MRKERLNSKIINSITPFSKISYEKKTKIDIFVGRDNDLKILTDNLFKSIYNNQSFGVTISGPGGCGKSTLFGYFTQLIETKELFQKNYCLLNKDDSIIIPCFIDAPKGETTTLKYFWTSIIDALAEEGMDFLEIFSLSLIIKCIEILWGKNFKRDKLEPLLNIIIPSFNPAIRLHRLSSLINRETLFNILTTQEELAQNLQGFIYQGWRILQSYQVSLKITNRSINFIQNRRFKFEMRYFNLLFDILSLDPDKSMTAQSEFKGVEGDLIISDNDVVSLFNWLTQTWEWIEEKPICLLIGVDNIGYLTVNLENRTDAYYPFIQTILQMRESLKKFLFVLIGTSEDWRLFNEFTSAYQDYRSQLRGFIVDKIDLTRLTLTEVQESLSLIMNKFWSQAEIINPSNPLYPFSNKFFTYLYEYYTHDYRSILLFLDKIWMYYKSSTKVLHFHDNPFEMMKFVRIDSKRFGISQTTSDIQYLEDLSYNNLIDWEKVQIQEWFANLEARHIGSHQSRLVEENLVEIIRFLQEREEPKQIDWVQRTPPININVNNQNLIRYPDVYVKLTPETTFDKKRTFEIQVKMYDRDKYVKLNEIKSSLELLIHSKTDALLFTMSGAGLEENCIERIKNLNLEDRILYAKPLDLEQYRALAFLIAYKDITGKKPSIIIIKEILSIIFNQPWDSLLEKIRNIGSYRDKSKDEVGEEEEEQEEGEEEEEEEEEEQEEDEEKELYRIIQDLNLEVHKFILKNIYKRYKNSLKELKFIFNTALNRPPRYKGKVTKEFLKKNVPSYLTDEDISENFIRLRNEFTKNEIPQEELLFTYKGTSIIITDLGLDFSKILDRLSEIG